MPVVEVRNETSLAAARQLGDEVACLVFASARSPGGGFLNGAQASRQPSLLYSDRVIYSPGVPVFRDDDGTLLDYPYPVSFPTSAAPNLGAILSSQPACAPSVPGVLAARARRVLEVAAAHGHRRLVLGAWGCGVFRNDPAVAATVLADQVAKARGRLDQVVLAVLDRQRGTPTFSAFASAFRRH